MRPPFLTVHLKELSRLGASKGGKARASVLTSDERKEIARNAVNARWAKVRGDEPAEGVGQVEPLRQVVDGPGDHRPDSLGVDPDLQTRVSLFKGDAQFGGITVPCHVLNDGNRVIAQREVIKALTQQERPSGNITRLIDVPALAPYINADEVAKKIIQFELSGPGHQMTAYGYEATLIIELCEAFLRARDDIPKATIMPSSIMAVIGPTT